MSRETLINSHHRTVHYINTVSDGKQSLQANQQTMVSRPDTDPLSKEVLTEREAQVLYALAKGLSNKEIGHSYQISAHTVACHVQNIYRKLAVHSRGEAVYEAWQMGLLAL